MGLAMLPTISGCVQGPTSTINKVIQAVGDLQPFPKATGENKRFAIAFQNKTISHEEVRRSIKVLPFCFQADQN